MTIDEILLRNGFDILENGCCYTDKHRVERAMKEYAAEKQKEVDRLKEENEKLKKEISGWILYKQNIDEALNSGDGTYRP